MQTVLKRAVAGSFTRAIVGAQASGRGGPGTRSRCDTGTEVAAALRRRRSSCALVPMRFDMIAGRLARRALRMARGQDSEARPQRRRTVPLPLLGPARPSPDRPT